MSNPHEASARLQKATKPYRAIRSQAVAGGYQAGQVAGAVSRWNDAEWAKAAVLAAVRPASQATREIVLGWLREDAANAPCPTCGRRGGGHSGWCSTEQWHAEQRAKGAA